MNEGWTATPVLDHGYVRLVETWGSDERIVESARMSTAKGFQGWGTDETPGDEKLLRHLYTKRHSTPFEFAGATFEIQAPLMVFREWHRHRVPFGYSERSARYAPLPDQNYSPTPNRMMISGGTNKQAGSLAGSETLTLESALEWLAELADAYDHVERVYQSGLRRGVPKELARLPVSVGRYSVMRATGNLRGWLGFATLRSAPDAQWEIRQYSQTLEIILQAVFPRTLALFEELRRGP